MEYLQRLLGTLQQAVNFVSSFTSYLLGDEAHPGAGETENARETSSHQNCEVETTHYGDVLPGGYLEVLERPLTTEVTSPHQEIQERVEAQTTVVVSGLSEQPCKYEKETQQKLSDPCQLQAGATQENITALVTGVKQKKDLEGLLEWEPKRTSLEEASQQEVQEKVIDNKWEPIRPLDGSKEHEESETGSIRVDQDKQLPKASWTQEEAQEGVPNWAQFLGEQQRELEKTAWAGGFQHGELKDTTEVINGQQLEAEKLEEIEAKKNQKEETKKVAVEEEILESILSEAGNEKNQEEVLEEEEKSGKSYHKEVEETGGNIAGLEKEWEETLWNEEYQQGAPDRNQLEEATAFQHGMLEEVNQIAECQQLETAKEEAEADEDQKREPDSMAVEERIQEAKVDVSEAEKNQEEVLEKEEKMGRSHQWEPKGEVEEEREMDRRQEKELEETLWNKVVVKAAPDFEHFLEEQEVVLGTTTSFVEFQYEKLEEADNMAESQGLEGEKKHGEVEEEKEVEEKENVIDAVERKEGDHGELNGEETGEGQQKALEVEERSHQWESKEEGQETMVDLERELEGIWRNKEIQQGTLDWSLLVTKQQSEPVQLMGCFGGLHHAMDEEVDKTIESQQLGLAKIEEREVKGEEDEQWESNSTAVEEGIMEYMMDKSETVGGQEEMHEEKEGKGRNDQWETRREAGEERGTNEKKQERELEQILCNTEVLQRSSDWDQFVEDQWVRLEGTAESAEFQTGELEEADKMAELQCLEGEVHGEVEVGKEVEEKKDMIDTVEGKEEVPEGMPSGEETGGDPHKVLEEVERSCQWESKEEAEDVGEMTVALERELVETSFSNKIPQMSLDWEEFVEEQRVGLEGTAPSVASQCGQLEEAEKMIEKQCLEVERNHAEEVEVAEEWKGMVDIVAGKEGIQKPIPSGEEIGVDHQEAVEMEEEMERSCQWEPKEEKVEKTTVDQERELERTWKNKKAQQDAPERTQSVIQQEELAKMPAWTGGLQPGLLDLVAEVKQLEVEQEDVNADKYNQQDLAIVKEIQEGGLDEAKTEKDYEEDPKGNKDVRTDQWELRETAMNFQGQYGESKGISDNSKDQQGKLAEAEENEGDQQKEPVKNEAQATGEEHEEHTGRVLKKDKEEESMKLAAAWCLDKEVPAKIAGDQWRQLEEKQKSLEQQGSLLSSASLERPPLPGPQTFQVEVTPLDTSAQKERVLLRRKSSIRRAPSLKRPRPSVENLPQETDVTSSVNIPHQTDVSSPVNTPPQPQPPPRAPRPTTRHAGFGPMHPNMMAELQMRLRKPQ